MTGKSKGGKEICFQSSFLLDRHNERLHPESGYGEAEELRTARPQRDQGYVLDEGAELVFCRCYDKSLRSLLLLLPEIGGKINEGEFTFCLWERGRACSGIRRSAEHLTDLAGVCRCGERRWGEFALNKMGMRLNLRRELKKRYDFKQRGTKQNQTQGVCMVAIWWGGVGWGRDFLEQ